MATEYGGNTYNKYGQPSLDLVFTGPKKSLKNRVGNQQVEFTRASTATYVGRDGLIKTSGEDEPRFDHDPATGESLGLLIEESRTNLITQSEDLSTTWFNGSSTLDPAITNPVGNTGTVYYLPAGAERLIVWNGTGSSTVAVSVFIKQRDGEVSTHVIQVWQSGAFLGNVQCPLSGDFTPTGNYSNGVRTAYPNGWFKFSFTATGPGTFGTGCRLDTEQSTNYTWGYQIEEGSFPTSYIPTSGSTVTRSPDIAQMTGDNFSSWYGGLAGTYTVEALNKTTINQYPIVCDDGTTGNRVLFATSGAYQLQIKNNGSTSVQLDAQPGVGQPQGMTKYAGSYSPDGASIAYGGVSNTDSTADIPQCIRLQIGQFSGDSRNVTISRISYYPQRLTDLELQTITL